MKKISDLVAVIGFSLGALLLFRIPIHFPNEDLDSTLPYVLIALSFYYFVHQYQLPSLKYFRLPELSIPSAAGLIVVCFYSYTRITSDSAIMLPVVPTLTGLLYLFALGAGEELVSRGFVFGVLRQYGATIAVVFSSVFFGLMHLNLYTGSDWNAYMAYWHCLSAAGFGVLAAVIMIVTRSIYSAIVMHSLFDWTVIFSKPSEEGTKDYVGQFDPLWQTIKDSFAEISVDVSIALILLAVLGLSRLWSKLGVSRKMQALLLKFGFIKLEEAEKLQL